MSPRLATRLRTPLFATLTVACLLCIGQFKAGAQVAYPQFINTGHPAQDSADYEAARARYAEQKAASVAGAARKAAALAAAADAGGKGTSLTTGNVQPKARQLATQSCIIPRDASWARLPLDDDNSSGPIPLGFTFNLYGVAYNSVYVNNNGNITFNSGYSSYSSTGFPLPGNPMIAPFWADVDTRSCGGVYYKSFGTYFIVTWESVGYYSAACDKRNTFQLVISNGTDPVVGLGLNVKFNYGDMGWTTGSASGGSGGFGGTPATAGVNKGADNAYVQIGRFGTSGVAYDGGAGATDGVDYLDYECFSFNVSNASNIPPSLQGLPANNTFVLNCNQTATVTVSSQGPEVNQSTVISVDPNGTCGVTSAINNSATAGGISTATITIAAGSCNIGTNTIIVNATDNGSPARTTSATITIIVNGPSAPTITGPAFTCPGGTVTLTANGGSNYNWNTNATTPSINVQPGTYSVTQTVGSCTSAPGTFTVLATDNEAPAITCPGNATLASCETAIPDYRSMATTSDNCSGAVTVSQSPAAGSAIASGATVTVTLTATDAAGNSTPCSFTVTRPDITPVAADDAALVCAGNSVTVNVLNNDSHPQGAALTINDYTQPSVGTLVKNADNTFTYTAPANYNGPVTFTYTNKAADATLGYSGNGHYYEWVPSYGITWTDARNQASQRYYSGLQGYLVTITSQAEMNFVATKLQGSGWMGASDLAYEGTWRWVTGPEGLEDLGAGRHFSNQFKYDWCGASTAPGINGYFSNWAGGEPNDCGANVGDYSPTDAGRGGEHYAHFYAGGIWNDYPNDAGGNIQGYIVEYGGLEGCIPELTATATVTIQVNGNPSANVTASSDIICNGSAVTLSANASAGSGAISSYKWLRNGTAIAGATSAIYATTVAGSYSVVVFNSNGCSATSANSYALTTGTSPSIANVNVYIQASTSASGCSAVVNYPVSVSGTPAPSVSYVFSGATSGAGSGTGSGATFSKGITHVKINASNSCGSTSAEFDVTVVDDVKPVVTCKPATIALDDNGVATVSTADIHNSSSDNCSPVSLSLSREGTICATAAENGTITMTAPYGTIIDRIDFASYGTPNGSCGSFSIGGCHASTSLARVQAAALNHNSFTIVASNATFGDPCFGTVKRMYIQAHYTASGNTTSFNCSNLGANTVTLTATDASGNAQSCTTAVTVVDNTAPVITTANGALDRTVECSDAAAINAALALQPQGRDNCSFTLQLLSDVRTAGCGSTYTRIRKWQLVDGSGNTSGVYVQTIKTIDTQAPSLTVSDIAVNNDAGQCGAAVSFAAQASDNCSTPAVVYSHQPGSFFPVGATTVTATATDACGNATTRSFVVTVTDNELPAVHTNSFTIQLDASGAASITEAQVDNGSSDNCAVQSVSLDKTSYDCSNVGDNTVTLTVTDIHGNVNTGTATITVEDKVAPVITCPASVTLNCQDDASVAANGSATASDACGISSITSSDASTQVADINNAGHYNYTITRTWTAVDNHENSSQCVQTIKVQDVTAPVITTEAASLDRTVECSDPAAIADAVALAPAATDNCAPVTIHLVSDVTTANCGTTYTRVRTWNFTDPSNNTSAIFTQTISVVDRTAPVITTNATAIEHCFDSTSTSYPVPAIAATDNCNTVSYSYVVKNANGGTVRYGYSTNASGMFPVGTNTIYWTVTDACGNATPATTTVRINAPITGSFSSFTATGGNANTLYTSDYAPAASANITMTAGGGTPGYSFSWSVQSGTAATITGGANTATATVKANGSGTVVLAVVVTDSKGCKAIFRKTIWVIDARCGNKGDKVLVCHNTASGKNPWVQICVAPSAVPAQLGNGSYLGACSGNAITRSIEGARTVDGAGDASLTPFPNPSRGIVNLRVSGMSGAVQVDVLDGRGNRVQRRQTTVRSQQEGIQLSLQGMAAGVYTVRLSDGKQVLTTRVVIAH